MLTPANTQIQPPRNWEDFEHLCWMLWKAEWRDSSTQKHGRKGQSQSGVDVYGEPKTNHWSGIQCKGKDNYSSKQVTVTELRREVEKAKQFEPPLKVFILATTARRDAKIQAEARRITAENRKQNLFSVNVSSWDDICELLDLHEDVFAKCYPGNPVTSPTHAYNETLHELHEAIIRRQEQTSKKLEEFTQHNQAFLKLSLQEEDIDDALFLNISPEQMNHISSVLKGDKQRLKNKNGSIGSPNVRVLSPERTQVLGILAVASIPFSAAALKSIFRDTNWQSHLSYFRKHKLVTLADGKYAVPPNVSRSFVGSKEERRPYHEAWTEALEPIKWHPDTAFFLAMHLMAAGKLQDSIDTLVEAAVALLPGHWNETYLSVLLQIERPELKKILTKPQQVSYLNSVALCLYRAKRYEESIKWFMRLRKLSKRVRNNWGIGQSYHNCGIVYVERGDLSKAESCFRNSVAHTRKARDHFLLGRSLYELAVVIAGNSEEEARKLLEKSERVKKKVNDKAGLIGINHGQAILALQNGDHRQAVKWFKKAETAARNVDHYHAEALECYNVGRCYVDLGEYERALTHLRQAYTLAEKDELVDVILLSLGAQAMALTSLHRYKQAEEVFRRLCALHERAGDTTNVAISLHDIGATLLGQKKYGDARKALRRAVQYARKNEVSDWLYQSLADIGKSYVLEGHVEKAVAWLDRTAAKEAERKLKGLAAKLWIDAIEYSSLHHLCNSATSRAVAKCTKLARSKRTPGPLRAQLLATLHLWYWHSQDYKPGLKALEDLLEYAKGASDKELTCRAQDQIGVCLQELGQFKEAISAHRAALKAARRLADSDIIETSLNNLGEALRKTESYAEAVKLLEEAEASARKRNDVEAAISYAHNHALSLEHKGDLEAAENLFKSCRDEAKRLKHWHEYVRALHALANIAWHGNKPSLALKRYGSALKAADKYGSDNRHEICLNYANALRWKEQPKHALEVLRSASAEFQHILDAHLYHSQLAILYGELGKKSQAREQWELSYESAVRIGDDYAIALSSGALAEAHDDLGELKKADAHYETALKYEGDDALRIQLLLERLGILLQLKREKDVESVFEEIRSLAKNEEFLDEYINAHVMLGDFNWTEGNLLEEGLKAYLAAMAASGGDHIERYFEIGARTTMRLAHIGGRNKEAKLKQLGDTTIKWLKEEQGIGEKSKNRKYLLWPFSAALRLIHSGSTKPEPDEEEFATILEEEFEKLWAR